MSKPDVSRVAPSPHTFFTHKKKDSKNRVKVEPQHDPRVDTQRPKPPGFFALLRARVVEPRLPAQVRVQRDDDAAMSDTANEDFSVKEDLFRRHNEAREKTDPYLGEDGRPVCNASNAKATFALRETVRGVLASRRELDPEDLTEKLSGEQFDLTHWHEAEDKIDRECKEFEREALKCVNVDKSSIPRMSLHELRQAVDAIPVLEFLDAEISRPLASNVKALETALAVRLFGKDFKKINTRAYSNEELMTLHTQLAQLPYVPTVLETLKSKIDDRIALRKDMAGKKILKSLEVLTRTPKNANAEKLLRATFLVTEQAKILGDLGGNLSEEMSARMQTFVDAEKAKGDKGLKSLHALLTTGDGRDIRGALSIGKIDRMALPEVFLKQLTLHVTQALQMQPATSVPPVSTKVSTAAENALMRHLHVFTPAKGPISDGALNVARARINTAQVLKKGLFNPDVRDVANLIYDIQILRDVAVEPHDLAELAKLKPLCSKLADEARALGDEDRADDAQELLDDLNVMLRSVPIPKSS